MDEPFGSVDPLNRVRLQAEFRGIQRRLGKTVLFVTHDVEEAVRLADSIAVMKAGRIVQHASPRELSRTPAGPFVRDFLGSDYGLQLLGRFLLREVVALSAAPGEVPPPGRPLLNASATVKEALSLMIASGADCISVQDGERGLTGSFRLADVLRVLGAPA
jgi:osmoprotectant transport system ATP-binding protein